MDVDRELNVREQPYNIAPNWDEGYVRMLLNNGEDLEATNAVWAKN